MKVNQKSNAVITFFLAGMAFIWVIFATMFGIFSYIESIYFALDKVSGHFFSLPIQLTFLFFVLLLFFYGMLIVIFQETNYFHQKLYLLVGLSLLISVLAALFTYPVGALDIFNYVLMGKLLVFYQQNPFIVPFDSIASQDILHKYAIFLDVTTGYGPWWLLLTSGVVFLSGTSSILSMVMSYKLMTLIFFLLTGWVIYLLTEEKKNKLLTTFMYLGNPFIIFEGIVNGHNDILVSFFILLAWIAYKKKNLAVFMCIILAGLVKFYALVLLPIFLVMVIKERWKKKDIFLSFLAAGICAVLLYLPFWSGGALIHGVLEGLHNAQVINGYSPYSLTREFFSFIHTSASTASIMQYGFVLLFLSVVFITVKYVLKTRDYLHGSICLLLTFFLTFTIYQPWYSIPVLGLVALLEKKSDRVFSLLISIGALLSYPLSVWAWFHSGWSALFIHLFLSCFIALPSLVYVIFLLKTMTAFRNKVLD